MAYSRVNSGQMALLRICTSWRTAFDSVRVVTIKAMAAPPRAPEATRMGPLNDKAAATMIRPKPRLGLTRCDMVASRASDGRGRSSGRDRYNTHQTPAVTMRRGTALQAANCEGPP